MTLTPTFDLDIDMEWGHIWSTILVTYFWYEFNVIGHDLRHYAGKCQDVSG